MKLNNNGKLFSNAKSIEKTGLYTGLFFLFFCVLFIFKLPEYAHTNTVAYYFCLDYSMGFGARMFMGTVFDLLFSGNITADKLFLASCVVTLAICLMISRFMGEAWAKIERGRHALACLIILILVYPFSINFFFSGDCLGRLEVYCLFFSLLAVSFVNIRILRWVIPALCFAAMATYEGFALTFMPLVAVILLYKVIDSGFKRDYFALCVVSYAVIIASFVYFQFATPELTFNTAYEMFLAASSKYSGVLDRNALDAFMILYYTDSSTYWADVIFPILKDLLSGYVGILAIIVFPFIAILTFIWTRCFKKASSNIKKFFFVVCAVLPAASIPMYVLATDWGRWTACWICVQLLTVIILTANGDNEMQDTISELSATIKKYPFATAIIVIFAASLYLSSVPDSVLPSIGDDALGNYKHWFEARY